MILLTRFNGTQFYLNITHIEAVEATPDTMITLTNGKKLIVTEAAHEVAAQITAFYQQAAYSTAAIPHSTGESTE